MNSKYDVIILGAGINGVAAARSLSLCGKTVLVIEKKTIAAGASSHSSRLIHGGIRYLENLEFSLVQEALHDQKYLLETYPNLVKLTSFYFPLYKSTNRKAWMVQIGFWLYSFFAKHGKKAKKIPVDYFAKKFPLLCTDDLLSAFEYFDAITDDKLLTQTIAQEAIDAGAHIYENTLVQNIEITKSVINIAVNNLTIQTSTLINASGAWINETIQKFNLPSRFIIEKISGIHLVLNNKIIAAPLLLETSSKRIFFIIPLNNQTLIGTTERKEEKETDAIQVNPDDVTYLLDNCNKYLKKKITHDDIHEVFIGARPIIRSNKDISKMSREYKLDLHRNGSTTVLNIFGGKLSTFPSLANKVANLLTK